MLNLNCLGHLGKEVKSVLRLNYINLNMNCLVVFIETTSQVQALNNKCSQYGGSRKWSGDLRGMISQGSLAAF